MRVAILGLAFLLPCRLALSAQDVPVFGVQLDMIKAPVTVTDADGRLVKDLTPDDFVILEDGRTQKIELFARAFEPGQDETLALDLGILFDTSESMRNVIKLSQEAVVRFLDAVPRAHELYMIFFDQDIRISRYESERQQGLFERILDAQSSGNTALYDAIGVYISRVFDQTGRKVLVLFTDGQDTTSGLTQSEAMRLLRASGVTVFPIGFVGDRSPVFRALLDDMAKATGGRAYFPSQSKDLPVIYADILDVLENQYVLGYTSTNTARDGKFRKLKIEVKRSGLMIRHRAGYEAPRDPKPRK
jgi:Ca-activated chloride channel homolog